VAPPTPASGVKCRVRLNAQQLLKSVSIALADTIRDLIFQQHYFGWGIHAQHQHLSLPCLAMIKRDCQVKSSGTPSVSNVAYRLCKLMSSSGFIQEMVNDSN